MRIRTFILLFVLGTLTAPLQARRSKSTPKKADRERVASLVLSVDDQRIFDYYFQEAVNLKYQGRLDAAFDLFRYCVSLDSLNAEAWYETSLFYGFQKQAEPALQALKQAYSLDKGNEWYALALANAYLSQEKIQEAIVLYEELVKNKPDDENILYQLAALYNQTGDYKSAINSYNHVERLIGKNESVSFEKYKLYKQVNQSKKAIKEIETLCNEFPYDVDYVLLLGDAWMDLKNPNKAFAQYETAKALDPHSSAVALSLADYYNETGDSIAAQKQLVMALTNPGTDVDTKLTIFSQILSTSLETADSIKIPTYFDILLEQHPNEYKIRHLHVQWLMQKGKKQEAKDELRNVLDLNPNQLPVWKTYLELNAESDNQNQIGKICTEALTYFPNEPIFWFYQGLRLISDDTSNNELTAKAIEHFKKAVSVSKPEDLIFISRVYGLIGDAYFTLKDDSMAYQYYDKALETHPGNILVLNNYAYYLSEAGGDLAKAESMSKRTVDAEPQNATYLDTYAWIFFKEAKYGLAKIYIERAVQNEPDPSSVILEHYGDILWFNDEKEAARAQWKKATGLQNPSEILLRKVESGDYVKP